jgi:hypothetical protein
MISTILLYFAVVFAFIAALFVDVIARPPFNINFGWLAIAFWILSIVLGGIK